MKNYMLMFVLISLPAFCFGNELIGVWVKDRNSTIEFNANYSKQYSELLSCGKLKITYTKDYVLSEQNSHICNVRGVEIEVPRVAFKYSYKVVDRNDRQVVIETIIDENESIYEVLNFLGPNLFWVYSGGVGEMEDSHLRTYFKRVGG